MPDVILLDVHLPDRNGLAFLQRMRQEPSLERVPVILITSDLKRDTIAQARRLEVADFIAKPFNRETVSKKVGQVAARAMKARRENFVRGSANVSVNRRPGVTIFRIDGDFSVSLLSQFQTLLTEQFRKVSRNDRYVLDLTAQPQFADENQLLERLIEMLGAGRLQFLVGRNYANLVAMDMDPEDQLFFTQEDLDNYNSLHQVAI